MKPVYSYTETPVMHCVLSSLVDAQKLSTLLSKVPCMVGSSVHGYTQHPKQSVSFAKCLQQVNVLNRFLYSYSLFSPIRWLRVSPAVLSVN